MLFYNQVSNNFNRFLNLDNPIFKLKIDNPIFKLKIMGDYQFPVLITPSIGIEPIPPPPSGSVLPLHQEVIYI